MPINLNVPVANAVEERKANTVRRVSYEYADKKNDLKAIKQNAKNLAKLALLLPSECTFEANSYFGYRYPDVEIPRALLPAVFKAIGRLSLNGKDIHDAEKRLVNIYLKSDKFPGIKFQYVRPLPPVDHQPANDGDMVCDIQEVTTTHKTLVCRPRVKPAPAVAVVATPAIADEQVEQKILEGSVA